MKKGNLIIIVLIAIIAGCASVSGNRVPASKQDISSWVNDSAAPYILEYVTKNSFLKGKPFVIVKSSGEDVDHRIDKLTERLREQITGYLLQHTGVLLVRRQPVRAMFQPYKIAELPCENVREFQMLITIDIKESGEDKVSLDIRAIDMKTSNWIAGFSLHENFKITEEERISLNTSNSDEQLRGLRFLPFGKDQPDKLTNYLAQNLSCLIRSEAEYGIKVYFDMDDLDGGSTALMSQLGHELNLCREIQTVDNRDAAQAVIKISSYKVADNLNKLYVELAPKNEPRLTTSAYVAGW